MPIPVIDRKNKIIMFFSLKAGCTVALRMFFDHMGLSEEIQKYRAAHRKRVSRKVLWEHRFRANYFYKNYGTPTDEEINDPNYFKFKVVRNPYTRAVSGYIHSITWDGFRGSFARFVKTFRFKGCNAHLKPQSESPEVLSKINRIVKIENLDNDIKEINGLIGSNFRADYTSFHHLTKTDGTEFVGQKVFRRAPKKDPPSPSIPDYRYFYNKKIADKVAQIYHKDLLNFGYGFPYEDYLLG